MPPRDEDAIDVVVVVVVLRGGEAWRVLVGVTVLVLVEHPSFFFLVGETALVFTGDLFPFLVGEWFLVLAGGILTLVLQWVGFD